MTTPDQIVDERQRLHMVSDLHEIARYCRIRGEATMADVANEAAAILASRPQEQPRKATGEAIEAVAVAMAAASGFDWAGRPEVIRGIYLREAEAAINAVRALSVSPAAAEGWQPMVTAPRDGTHILARGVRGEASPPTTVHWFGPPDLPGLRAGGWYISVQQDEGPRVHPTAWAPLPVALPAAPSSPAAQEQKASPIEDDMGIGKTMEPG